MSGDCGGSARRVISGNTSKVLANVLHYIEVFDRVWIRIRVSQRHGDRMVAEMVELKVRILREKKERRWWPLIYYIRAYAKACLVDVDPWCIVALCLCVSLVVGSARLTVNKP